MGVQGGAEESEEALGLVENRRSIFSDPSLFFLFPDYR